MPDQSIINSPALDLSQLPAPDIIYQVDFQTVFDQLRADFAARNPEYDAFLESDPAIKLLEVFAYRLTIERVQANERARGNLVAYARAGDLDHLAAFFGVVRLTLVEADPGNGIEAVLESDDDLRRRVLLAPDGYSVAGPRDAYVFHALSADSRVRDASATSPAPGDVVVTILNREGDGTAPADLIDAVNAVVNADTIRPLTDRVTVQSADIVTFDIAAGLILYPGPDGPTIKAAAEAALSDYLDSNALLGRDVSMTGIIAALHVGGVQRVSLAAPLADIAATDLQAALAQTITITIEGTAE